MTSELPLQPLNILIAEDSDDDAEMLLRALRQAGMEVRWQRVQTREAFEAQLSPRPDIILADYSLPQFGALEALRILKEQQLDIPLIIVSGTIGEEAAVEGLKLGAVDYLLKDRLGRLGGAIRGALAQRALRVQRQEAIDALRFSESRYRAIVEDSLQGIVISQDNRIVYANRAYADMMGYGVEQLLALSVEETASLVHPEDLPRLQEYQRRRMEGDSSPMRYEYRVIRKDGSIRWMDAFVTPTSYQGRRATQAYYVDITERKQAEAAAREQQARARVEQILNAIGEGVVVLDQNGRVSLVNPAFVRQTGFSEEEIVGKTYQRLWSQEVNDSDEFLEKVQAQLARRSSWRGQAQIQRRNGANYDAAMTVTRLQDGSGARRELVVSIRDISQMKEVERMKDAIISIAAHELRTPLTTISLYSEVLATREVAPAQRTRYLNTIFEQTQQLTKIIDDMLDLARLEAGRGLEISSEPVDIEALVHEVVKPFAELDELHRFQLEGLEQLAAVAGDPMRLTQVLRNILSNAVKYSPDGGAIIIRGRNLADFVEISVQDEGIGMTPEQQAQLFEKFYRAHTSSSGPRGTGLGLAICRLIVEGHGGEIWAQSKEGVGSTFTFTAPILAGD